MELEIRFVQNSLKILINIFNSLGISFRNSTKINFIMKIEDDFFIMNCQNLNITILFNSSFNYIYLFIFQVLKK